MEKSQGRKVSTFFGRQKAVAPDPEEDPDAPLPENGDEHQDEGRLGRREAPEAVSKKAEPKAPETEKVIIRCQRSACSMLTFET